MKPKILLILLSIVLLSGIISSAVDIADAQDTQEGIKDRMKNRLSTIISLKKQGIIGEDNKGFLQFVGSVRENVEIVNAENTDRKIVYDAIAKNQGATPDVVGTRRALQIAENAEPGDWLQDVNGKWYQK
jgi:uncharacterized protein YdbL (DUF1318 family)